MQKIINIIEQSFLRELLSDTNITDISYNGKDLYYFSSLVGRKFYKRIDDNEVAMFLRNIANHANERFSYSDTFLDISVDKYRLSAMHYAVSRFGYEQSYSFALRINHHFLKSAQTYLNDQEEAVLKTIITEGKSLIISGTTGVGKTTLQKYLVTLLPPNTRVLVIDNVLELGEIHSLNETLDLTLWQTKTNNETEIKDFVQKALRFHPDYLIIAESRGSEMREILQGAISGHPNIVTIHAESAELVYDRIVYLTGISDRTAVLKAYPYVVHLTKRQRSDETIHRYIAKITKFCSEKGIIEVIYEGVITS